MVSILIIVLCFYAASFLNIPPRIRNDKKIQALIKAWKNFCTPIIKISIGIIIFAIIIIEHFIPLEFPVLGKPLPYAAEGGYGRSGKNPPYEYNISITLNVEKTNPSSADLAATCAAAARYFSENYGLPDIRVNMYDFINEIQKIDQCYVLLGKCRYSPRGSYLYKEDKDSPSGWSDFEVARDIPIYTIRECNKVVDSDDYKDFDTAIEEKMGLWSARKLKMSYLEVDYDLLPKNLCEKPVNDDSWSSLLARNKLIDELEKQFTRLKEIGASENFPLCYKNGCKDRAYNLWARKKYLLWLERLGNFEPEIKDYNNIINDYAKARADRDKKKILILTKKMNELLDNLRSFKVCGNKE